MDKVIEFDRPKKSKEVIVPRTNREKEYYYRVFNLDDEGLKDKNVLDVGAGDSNFAQEVAHLTNVIVQLDAQYERRGPAEQEEAVTGMIQALPFKDASFDLIVASYSVMWIPDHELEISLTEMLRVVRTGGTIKIHPTYNLITANLPPQANFDAANQTLKITKEPGISENVWREDIRTIIGANHMGAAKIGPILPGFKTTDSDVLISPDSSWKSNYSEEIKVFPNKDFNLNTILKIKENIPLSLNYKIIEKDSH